MQERPSKREARDGLKFHFRLNLPLAAVENTFLRGEKAENEENGRFFDGKKMGTAVSERGRLFMCPKKKGGTKMGRMTESLKSEAVRLYFEENREESEIAEALNISMRQVKTVLGDLARLETYKKRSEAAKLRAQICVNKSAEEAARRQAALLLDGEVNETISQRAAKDILDRAGVRVPKESKSDVVIRFASGAPPLGMPESAEARKGE